MEENAGNGGGQQGEDGPPMMSSAGDGFMLSLAPFSAASSSTPAASSSSSSTSFHPSPAQDAIPLTSLSLVFQCLPLLDHLQAALTSRDWLRAGSAKLAWAEAPPSTTPTRPYRPPAERACKLVRVRRLAELQAMSAAPLTRHAHTLAIDLHFDFTTGAAALLLALPSLTSLTLNISDRARVAHEAVAACFAQDSASALSLRLRELCLGQVDGEAYLVDHSVSSLHVWTLYLAHLPRLETLAHLSYDLLDYSQFAELIGADSLHTLVISPQLALNRARVMNLRRLPNLTYLDWRGEVEEVEGADANGAMMAGQIQPAAAAAGAGHQQDALESLDVMSMLLGEIQLPTLEEADSSSSTPPSQLCPPPALRFLFLGSSALLPRHLPLLSGLAGGLELLHLRGCHRLFEQEGLDILGSLERAKLEAAQGAATPDSPAAHLSASLHSSHSAPAAIAPVLPLSALVFERFSDMRQMHQPPIWRPLSPQAASPAVDASSLLPSGPFRLRHLSISSDYFVLSEEFYLCFQRCAATLHTLHLRAVPLSLSFAPALLLLSQLEELSLTRCNLAALSPLIKSKRSSKSNADWLWQTLPHLTTLTALTLCACRPLRGGKELLQLANCRRLQRLTWSNSVYPNEPGLDRGSTRARSASAASSSSHSPSALTALATAWDDDYSALRRLQHAVNPSGAPLPARVLASHRRQSNSLVQLLKSIAHALRPSSADHVKSVAPQSPADSSVCASSEPPSRHLAVWLRDLRECIPARVIAPLAVAEVLPTIQAGAHSQYVLL